MTCNVKSVVQKRNYDPRHDSNRTVNVGTTNYRDQQHISKWRCAKRRCANGCLNQNTGLYTQGIQLLFERVFSERELTFTFAICYRPSVCLSSVVCLSVVCNARAPYSGGWNFRQYFTALGTLAIHWHPTKILRRSSQGNPSAGGVKHKRGNKI